VIGSILAVIVHIALLSALGLAPEAVREYRGTAEIIGAGVLFFCWSAALLWIYRRGLVTTAAARNNGGTHDPV
jgi:hypothetical protein